MNIFQKAILSLRTYGSLNVIDTHNLIRSGPLRNCGFDELDIAFLGGSVSLWGRVLRFLMIRKPSSGSIDF